MSLTLLELVQAATTELAIVAVPSAVATSTSLQELQFKGLANALGRMLTSEYEWQKIDSEYVLITVATTLSATTVSGSAVVTMADTTGLSSNYGLTGTGITPWAQIVSVDSSTQVTMSLPATVSATSNITFSQNQYDLPSDFESIINDTEWDRTNRWPLQGPQSAQEWQYIKGGIISNGPRTRFRILDGQIIFNPNPANNLRFAFEYTSNGWVRSSTGTLKTSFTADNDTCIFDDQLMITGLKLLWLQAKGLEWGYVQSQFGRRLDIMQAKDKGAPVLSISRSPSSIYLGPWSIPDGNWGSNGSS